MRELMRQASTFFPTLHPQHIDSKASINHMGDIIEIFLAVCRGNDSWSIYELHTVSEWRSTYLKLAQLCEAIDFVYSSARGKHETKYSPNLLDLDTRAYMLSSCWFFAHCIF